MATIYDMIEVTGITSGATYSWTDGTILGVFDGATSADLDDEEFDVNDTMSIGGTTYSIAAIGEPTSQGFFTAGDGSDITFDPGSESNLDVVFLILSEGANVRYFIVPNDSYGDFNVQSITLGSVDNVAGSDAAVIGTTDNTMDVVCFAGGTEIMMADGRASAVERITAGDLVLTCDGGAKPVCWIGSVHVPSSRLRADPRVAPIRIRPGALGQGQPQRALVVSQQHRLLCRSSIAARMFGQTEVLIAAKRLLPLDGIELFHPVDGIAYFHLLLPDHALVLANGAIAETLFPGTETMKRVDDAARDEIRSQFPGIDTTADAANPARLIVSGHRARRFVDRHLKNAKALVGAPMHGRDTRTIHPTEHCA